MAEGKVTHKELKEGLTLNEHSLGGGVKLISFTNSTVDKQFICKYGFKGAEPEALGITKIVDGKWVTSVHPGETQECAKGKWTGTTKQIATGPCAKEWLEKKAAVAKEGNKEELQRVRDVMAKEGLSEGASSEAVAQACEKHDVPFIDVNFMPLDTSMKMSWEKGDIKMHPFKRPGQWELLTDKGLKPDLFVNKIEPCDVNQGSLADCYLMGAISSVALNERLVRNMFIENQVPDLGIYRVNLCKSSWWETIVIDDFVPCAGVKPAFGRNRDEPNELWVAMLEKAYAKESGSYFAVRTGQCSVAMADLTGCPHKVLATDEWQWEEVVASVRQGDFVVFGSPGKNLMYVDEAKQLPDDKVLWEKYRAKELICEHSYSLLKALVASNGDKMLELRHPWGTTSHGLWNGKYGPASPAWTDALKAEVGYQERDGVFWMTWDDAKEWFTTASVAYNPPDWESVRVKGRWNGGVPTCCIELDVLAPTQMWLGVHQADTRGVQPGSPNATYAAMNLYVVAPRKDSVKVVESWGTAKRDRMGLVQLDPATHPKVFIIGVPKDASVTKDFKLSMHIENIDAVNIFFNAPVAGTTHYGSAKNVILEQLQPAEVVYQMKGPKLSRNEIITRTGTQVGSAEPASRAPQSPARKAVHADPSGTGSDGGASPEGGKKKKIIKKVIKKGGVVVKKEETISGGPAPQADAGSDDDVAPPQAASPAQQASPRPADPREEVKIGVMLKSAMNLQTKGSQNIFCEVKLRTVKDDGTIGSDHPKPQKQTTKVCKSLSPEWNETYTYSVPFQDCIRVSVFAKKTMGKDQVGRVDLMVRDLKEGALTYPVVDDKGGEVGAFEIMTKFL